MTDQLTPVEIKLPSATGALGEAMQALENAMQQPVDLDLSEIKAMTSLQLQLVLSAQKQWQSEEIPFRVLNISEDCRASLDLLGLDSNHFQDEGA